MDKVYSFIIFLFLCPLLSTGQSLSDIDTNKYRIDLPSYWKTGSKALRILSDKLPLVSPELKDKDLCGDDCNPKYRIELYLSDPEIVDFNSFHIAGDRNSQTWQHNTYYAFECNLILFDENNKPITRFIIVDRDEVWTLVNKSYTPSYSQVPMKMVVTANTRDNILVSPVNQQVMPRGASQDPRRLQIPQEKDMFWIIDNKIQSWK